MTLKTTEIKYKYELTKQGNAYRRKNNAAQPHLIYYFFVFGATAVLYQTYISVLCVLSFGKKLSGEPPTSTKHEKLRKARKST